MATTNDRKGWVVVGDVATLSVDDLVAVMGATDAAVDAATVRARKSSRERKPPETLDEARGRVLAMKLREPEAAIASLIFDKLRDGELTRPVTAKSKISKKEIFEIYALYRETVREQKRQYVVDNRPSNYWIVTDVQSLNRLDKLMDAEREIGADTETTGLDMYNDRVIGYSVYLPIADVAAYVVFGHTTGQSQLAEDDAERFARKHFTRPELRTVWHNYKYDGHLLLTTWGIRVANPWWDTQVASKLLNEHERSHRLKDLHAQYVLGKPDDAIMFEDLFDDHVIYDKDIILSGIYAAGDAHKTYELYRFQKPHIDDRDRLSTVWYEIEQPLLDVDLRLERTGFHIDVESMNAMVAEYEPQLERLEASVRDAYSIDQTFVDRMAEKMGKTPAEVGDFNIQSNPHLGYLLYDVLGCDENIGLRFKKAKRSTAAEVIDALIDQHEHLAPLRRYRQLQKLVTTYLRKIPLAMEPATGRLHCRFNNLGGDDDGEGGTSTGRYSSSFYVKAVNSRTGNHDKGTNFQNIPSRSREGVLVRMCFVPDVDWLFVSSDLSQIEPRLIAHILYDRFGDSGMRDLYLAGRDLYTEMAMFTFGFAEAQCVDGAYDPTGSFKPRKLMKEGVLAFLYGQSPMAFARRMKVSTEIATAFFDGMTTAYPGLRPFREWVLRQLLTRGSVPYAETLFGRKRRFPGYRENHAELSSLESKFFASGVKIYQGDKLGGRTVEERVEIDARRTRLAAGTLTDDDREAIMRIGMYWWHKDDKERYWEVRGKVREAERQAVNAIIQGSAADVLKRAMIRLARFCEEHGYRFHASIHDEVMLSVPKNHLNAATIAAIDDIMTKTTTFTVPLANDTVISPKWMCDYKAHTEWDYENCRPTDAAIQARVEHDEPTGYETTKGVIAS